MRISFAANHGDIGGGEVMLLAMARAARELGRDVEVVAPHGDLVEAAREAGFRTVTIHADSAPQHLRGLRRWAGATKPDVLWCNGLKPAFATSFLPSRVVHLHSLPIGPLAALAEVAIRRARAVVVPSDWMNEELGGGRYVMPNWTGTLRRTHEAGPLADKRPVRLGFLGRLTSDKGALVLAEAVEILNRQTPGANRVVIGGASRFTSDGDADRAHTALAQLEPATEFLGWIDREDFFDRIDLAVFPSVFPESFGLVAAESMAVGCPFVISDAGALPEVANHDPRFIAESGRAESLADAIRQAVEHYTPGRILRSRERWEEHYSPEAGLKRFGELLDSVEARP